VAEFYDAAVSGADHIEAREGFAAMLAYIASTGARTIIVETASRFARDLMVQEVGFAKLQALGIKLVAADSPHSFLDDTPTSKLIRQILGAVSEFGCGGYPSARPNPASQPPRWQQRNFAHPCQLTFSAAC
jgi:DNA invertase Pin-like site-specific DNA recombinase